MHVPTFGQVATVGMAFIAATALAAPVAEPAQGGLVEVFSLVPALVYRTLG